ncbi:TPA: hypothetical protein KC765_004904 [Escherichia coli O146]|nr:hypothetical protein [Escherichia coli O146]
MNSTNDLFNLPDTLVTAAVIAARPHLFADTDCIIAPLIHIVPDCRGAGIKYHQIPAKVTCMDLLDRGDVVVVFNDVIYLCPQFTNGEMPGDEAVAHAVRLASYHHQKHQRRCCCQRMSVEIICGNAGRV